MTTTRFAPSPTGYLHVGNMRPALMNYLIAAKFGGLFILRIDDTDPERSREEFVVAIKEDLKWLGLNWQKEERQSLRLERYAIAANELRKIGRLYECFETPAELELKRKKQLNMGRPPVYDRSALYLSEAEKERLREERGAGHWRFKLDYERIDWNDGIIGGVSIDPSSVSDPVVIRGDGQYLYTLASSVDDMEMNITDVVRGSDHVTNTATQIQIIRALGGREPNFAHHSLLTGSEGESLSKRLGTLSLRDIRNAGIVPEALNGLMSRLGTNQSIEISNNLQLTAKNFELSHFGTAPTRFDIKDLYPLTARHLSTQPFSEVASTIAELGVPTEKAELFWDVTRENITTLNDLQKWWNIFSEGVEPVVAEEDKEFVYQAMALLPEEPFDDQTWAKWVASIKEKTGRKGKTLFMPLRLALTGKESGPDMARVLPLLKLRKTN